MFFITIMFVWSQLLFLIPILAQETLQKIIDQINIPLPQELTVYDFKDATMAAANPAPAWLNFQKQHPYSDDKDK